MTERPIIFNGDMVRAILSGEKTQMRRPVKPQPVFDHDAGHPHWVWSNKKGRQVAWRGDIRPCARLGINIMRDLALGQGR